MKDETGGIPIKEFVGLRSKLYCYSFGNKIDKKAKGVKKTVIEKSIGIEDYKDALFNRKTIMRKMNTITSINHELYTNEINKIALNGDDDKRYILEDNINTLALGHYKI